MEWILPRFRTNIVYGSKILHRFRNLGSDRYSAEQVAEAVKGAISVGYRHIDCASVYGNQHLIGEVLQQVMEAGIKREELWITSKLWNDMHGEGMCLSPCADIEGP